MSAVVITNQTAFPLNIALVRIIPLQHTNALEPGKSWTTPSPSCLHLTSTSPHAESSLSPSSSPIFNLLRSWPNLNHLFLRRQPLQSLLNLITSSTTIIEVHFDHENNRFCRTSTLYSLICCVLRISGYLSLSGALAMMLGRQILVYTRPHAQRDGNLNNLRVQAHIVDVSLAVLGLLLLLACSWIGNLPHSSQSSPPPRKPILSVSVPTSSLHPSVSSPPPSSFTTTTTTLIDDATARAHKHFAVTWKFGRFVLWDVHLQQEVGRTWYIPGSG